MRVAADDRSWDVALLRPDPETHDGSPGWTRPESPSPVPVRLSASTESGCEAVGFPQSEAETAGMASRTVRQTEQVRGILAPAGQAKAQSRAGQVLPRHMVPLDVDSPTPVALGDWAGMSGAGVILPDGRLAGIVVRAEADHQLRRLYAVLIADVIDQSAAVAAALEEALGSPVTPEARTAGMYRGVLQDRCIGDDGLPVTVAGASLHTFGVRAAGIPDESEYLDYVPRSGDTGLREALQAARDDRRLLAVVGASASGKSRSAAEAARALFSGYRLLCPRHAELARLPGLPLSEISPALVWLDNLERYDERALRDTVETLRRTGITVVATIRRGELDTRMRGRSSLLAEILADAELTALVSWPANWSAGERDALARGARSPALRTAARGPVSPSAWVVAGPELQQKLDSARDDDERPARYALVLAVLDWHRTGTAQAITRATAIRLLGEYLPAGGSASPGDIDDALAWAFDSVLDVPRTTRQALLTAVRGSGALLVHDYVQDRYAEESQAKAIPDGILAAALSQEQGDEARQAIGSTARSQGSSTIASEAFFPPQQETDGPAAEESGPGRGPYAGAPYRGLMPFSEADAGVFYGRGETTAKLAARLEHDGPVVVTGPSGAGKSSLIRAGLLPMLARGEQLPGSGRWPRIVIEPGPRPMTELAARLSTMAGLAPEGVLAELSGGPSRAHRLFETALAAVSAQHDTPGRPRIMLVIDQFERIFTAADITEAERRAFVTAVCAAAAAPDGTGGGPPAAVILAIRADFIDHMLRYPELDLAMKQGFFSVAPMSSGDLLATVTGPAEAADLRIEPALLEEIMADIGTEASRGTAGGLLPLLSQAMLLTWQNRDGGRLTVAGYERGGGLAAAVETAAENAYAMLAARQRAAAREIIVSMTVLTSTGLHVRRAVKRAELRAGHPDPEQGDVDAVLGAFAQARLVVLSDETAELAHDILITAWGRLREWLFEEQQNMHRYSRLAEDASDWAGSGRPTSVKGHLYSGSRAAEARELARWAEKSPRLPQLSTIQRDFITASSLQARRARRHRQLVIGVLSVLAVAAGTLAAVASGEREVANGARAAVIAEQEAAASGKVADKSEALDTVNLRTAAQLAAAAWRIWPTTEARQAMQSVVTKNEQATSPNGKRTIARPAGKGPLTGAAFSPDGKTIAIASPASLQLWNLATGKELRAPGAIPGPSATVVKFSPDGKTLAVESGHDVELWDTVTGKRFSIPIGNASPSALSFSPDGKLLAVGSSEGTDLLNISAGPPEIIARIPAGGNSSVNAVAVSPDGRILVTSGQSGTRLWDIVDPARPVLISEIASAPVNSVSFSPDGKTLAAGSSDRTLEILNPGPGETVLPPLPTGNSAVTSVAFTPDGKTLATASADGTARLWNTATGNPIGGALSSGSAIDDVAFSPDGDSMVTVSTDEAVSLWRLTYRGSTGSLADRVCAIADSPVSRSEWSKFVPPGIPFRNVCP